MRRAILAAALALALPGAARAQWVNKSGTIAAGGASQAAIPANGVRSGILLQNPCSATESLWFDWTAAAVAAPPSVELAPCGSYETTGPTTRETVNVTAATTGHAYTAKERQ